MSVDDLPSVVTYRALLEAHLQHLLLTRTEGDFHHPVSEADCEEFLTQVRHQRDQWLSQDPSSKPPTLFPPFETVARDIYTNLVTQIDIQDPAFIQVWLLLDVLNLLSDHELCDPALSFWLVEGLLDSQTIQGCTLIFDYLESRREGMVAKFFPAKKFVILHCCNDLLRRLSRAEDTVFCGRVFIYLFQTFPLGDKSSVNLRGVYHLENVTTFDPVPSKSDDAINPMEIDSDPTLKLPSDAPTPASTAPDMDSSSKTGRSTPIPKPNKQDKAEPAPDLDTLYPKFWALQSLFSSPTSLFNPSSMGQLKDGIDLTLSAFRSVSTSSTTSTSTLSSRKRKASELTQSTSATPFNPKYLTNRDLFDLEIHDLSFRRHILVQSLIMLDFLLSLSPAAKTKQTGFTNKSVLYSYILSDDDTKWCLQTRAAIATYLQQQGSGNEGKMYYRMVDTMLSRDKNWVRWKGESCPEITRKPVDVQTYLSAQDNLLKITADASRPLLKPAGASDFDFLLNETSMESLKHPRRRHKVPTPEDYYKEIEMIDLDMDFVTTEEEKRDLEEKKQGKVWRALRASVLDGKRFKLADDLDGGTNYKALIGVTAKDEEAIRNGETNGDQQNDTKKDDENSKAEASVDGQSSQIQSNPPTPAEAKDGETLPDAPTPRLNPDAPDFVPSTHGTPIPIPISANDGTLNDDPADPEAATGEEEMQDVDVSAKPDSAELLGDDASHDSNKDLAPGDHNDTITAAQSSTLITHPGAS